MVIQIIARLMGANFFLIPWQQVQFGAMLVSMRSFATCARYVPNLIKVAFQAVAVQIIILLMGANFFSIRGLLQWGVRLMSMLRLIGYGVFSMLWPIENRVLPIVWLMGTWLIVILWRWHGRSESGSSRFCAISILSR
jgi:hypothetical protein